MKNHDGEACSVTSNLGFSLKRSAIAVSFIGAAVGLLTACGGGGGSDSSVAADASSSSGISRALSVRTWKPGMSDSFSYLIGVTGDNVLKIKENTNIYDIDLFDTSKEAIAKLQSQGRKVVCYFSAGSGENWREDYSRFLKSDLGSDVDGWAGEKWLDIRSANVMAIMKDRMKLAKDKGCDGVEPDLMDGHVNDSGFPLSAADQYKYNKAIADEAHNLGLVVGLKNDIEQLSELAPYFDFALNEQCHQYSECSGYSAFTNLSKPVFNVEYASKYKKDSTALCADAVKKNLYTIVLNLALDGSYRKACTTTPGTTTPGTTTPGTTTPGTTTPGIITTGVDWTSVPVLSSSAGGSVSLLKVFVSKGKLNVLISGSFPASTYYNLFIDTDGNVETGHYSAWWPKGSGADFMLQNNRLYRSNSRGWDWTQIEVAPSSAPVTFYSASNVELSIPLALLGLNESTVSKIGLGFESMATSWSVLGRLPTTGSSFVYWVKE